MPEPLTQFLSAAGAVAFLAKIGVDLAKMAIAGPPWLPVLLAVVFGFFWSFVLQVAFGNALTAQLIAQCLIIGVMGAGGAVGATELQKRAAKS